MRGQRTHRIDLRQPFVNQFDARFGAYPRQYGFVLNYVIGRNAIGLHMLNDLTVLKIL